MKLSDYVIKRLSEHNVEVVFTITGGGSMHLNDSLGKSQEVKYFCNHHEQACAIAAEGYSRTLNKLGVVMVTSGPGGTNTITGVIGQWTDSVPVLYISGQIKYETSIESCKEIGLRQLGDQEINIVDIVKPITKYSKFVNDSNKIKYYLDKAIYMATTGRPGPVWLDIPLNIQNSQIDEDSLFEFIVPPIVNNLKLTDSQISQCIDEIKKAKRPVLVVGRGVRIADAENELLFFAKSLNIPVVTTFNGVDVIESGEPLFMGRIGSIGNRAANFVVQNCDLYISIGSRNNIRQISYNWENYAREARKIIVDIDQAELNKPTIKADIAICLNAKVFLTQLIAKISEENISHSKYAEWLDWCLIRKNKYPQVNDCEIVNSENNSVDLYPFIKKMTECLNENDIIVAGNGSACVGLFQAGVVKKNQTMFWNSGSATMGYDLPAAIGASIASNNGKVICVAGDGSMQMNIQELQTIAFNNLPVLIFYLNNNGYISMRQTQKSFFNGRIMGSDDTSGIGFPNIHKIANAYGITTRKISTHNNIADTVKEMLELNKPVLCEVELKNDYIFSPKLSSEVKSDGRVISKPLEDMYPFLDKDELYENMLIKPLSE
jgi:acetolactate synthase-1/2/3 large subunit